MRRTLTLLAAGAVTVLVVLSPVAAWAHGSGSHVLTADQAPTVSATAVWDSMNDGIDVHITTTKFTFAPESVGQGYVANEGHAHLTIDGNPVGRAYSEWVFIPTAAFGDGPHILQIALEANDHKDYMVGTDNTDGQDVDADVSFTVPVGMGFGSGASAMPGMHVMSDADMSDLSSPVSPWFYAIGGLLAGGFVVGLALTQARRSTTRNDQFD